MRGLRRFSSSSSSSRSASMKTVSVPESSIGLIIGKSGSTIKRLQSMQGISSVKLDSIRKVVEVSGMSEEMVNAVVLEIRKMGIISIGRNLGYSPDFSIMCYQAGGFFAPCIRLQQLRMSRVVMCQAFSDDFLHNEKRTFVWYASDSAGVQQGEIKPNGFGKGSRTTSIAVSEMGIEKYGEALVKCFSRISSNASDQGTELKLEIKVGKALFFCGEGAMISNEDHLHIEDIEGLLKRKFCDVPSSKDIAKLATYLDESGYVNLPNKHKVSLHLVDFKLQTKHNVSLVPSKAHVQKILDLKGYYKNVPAILRDYVEKGPPPANDEGGKITFSRILRMPKRHGFVMNMHEGKVADLRLSILTRELDPVPSEELLHWVEEAWEARTAEGHLSFNPEGRFHVAAVRYKEVHRFMLRDFMVRIAKVAVGEYDNGEYNYNWEVVLKSMWLKEHCSNVDALQAVDVDVVLDHVQALFEEANRITKAMGDLQL